MKKEITYVIGHKNPDTDSICSAMGLAELKSAEGLENAIAARAGNLNPQTSFILDYLKQAPPIFLPNVYPKATDVMTRGVLSVSEAAPLQKVMELMRTKGIHYVPVLDKAGRPSGALTLMDIARRHIDMTQADNVSEVDSALPNIVATLRADVIMDFLGDTPTRFSVYVGAMGEVSFLDMLAGRKPERLAIIVGDRAEIQKAAIEKGVRLLIVSGGFSLDSGLMEAARRNKVSVIVSPHDSATTALLVRLSTPAGLICANAFEKASADELVEDLKHRFTGTDGIIVLDDAGVMLGVVTKSNVLDPPGINLILVDHNEMSQAIDGADMVNIAGVVDHHRIGNFHTVNPITFICEPVGSTSTLVAELYIRKGIAIRKETAGLLLAGVISDTVMLKSPTTTDRDKAVIQWLEKNSMLDFNAFGTEIFNSTSSLKKRGPSGTVNDDYKVFEAKGARFGVGQVETIGFGEFRDEKARLLDELLKNMDAKKLRLSALLVTDIVYGTSLLLAVGERKVLANLNYPKVEDNLFELKGVISRKKQVVPHLLDVFGKIY